MPRTPLALRLYGWLLPPASHLFYGVLSPFIDTRLDWYRQRLKPRYPAPAIGRRVWIHAVSSGEGKVAGALRAALLAARPDLSVVLSSTTPSGFAGVRRIAGDGNAFVMPIDTVAAQRQLFETVGPDVAVLVESEFWPGYFQAAEEARVPIVVTNAILSQRSFSGHQRVRWLSRSTVMKASRIYAQDETIAGRFAALGVAADRISVCNNLKLAPPPGGRIAPDRTGARTITFGNIHIAELGALAPAILAMRLEHPDVRVILVPRYSEEFPARVLAQHLGSGLAVIDTLAALPDAGPLVWLGAMGVLTECYRRSELAVVCGTFDDTGGHDLAEPMHYGASSVYGPNVTRQRAVHTAFARAGCARQLTSAAELPQALGELLLDGRSAEAGQRFRDLSDAAQRHLDAIALDILALADRR